MRNIAAKIKNYSLNTFINKLMLKNLITYCLKYERFLKKYFAIKDSVSQYKPFK